MHNITVLVPQGSAVATTMHEIATVTVTILQDKSTAPEKVGG